MAVPGGVHMLDTGPQARRLRFHVTRMGKETERLESRNQYAVATGSDPSPSSHGFNQYLALSRFEQAVDKFQGRGLALNRCVPKTQGSQPALQRDSSPIEVVGRRRGRIPPCETRTMLD